MWAQLPRPVRLVMRFNMTLVGRLTIGPAIMIGFFLSDELKRVIANEPGQRAIWAWHFVGVAAVLTWVVAICGMPLWLYLVGFVYAGTALTRLRSFAEHRFADQPEKRTAIVENGGLLGLLYLNNNLHVLHHVRPAVAWYRLPASTGRRATSSWRAMVASSMTVTVTSSAAISSPSTTTRCIRAPAEGTALADGRGWKRATGSATLPYRATP